MSRRIERRIAHEISVPSNGRLEGYAAVFNSVSRDLGGWTESIKPGAFTRTLQSSEHVLALYDHDQKSVLGRVGSGTLRLKEDERGLRFQIDLPQTQVAKDLVYLIDRRDVNGASFAFSVPQGGDNWTTLHDKPHRQLLDVDLHEITVTANPAYVSTTIDARAARLLAHSPHRLDLAIRFLETVQ